MKTEKLRLASAVSILVLGAGCSLGSLNPAGGAASARDVGNEGYQLFLTNTNPILKYEELRHYSSDSAVEVVTDPSNGKQTLILITSTDLEINHSNYPMDGIHLFTTQSQESLDQAVWYAHGAIGENRRPSPILKLINFGVMTPDGKEIPESDRRMFAPDIKYVKETNKLFMYVPLREKNNKDWTFGIAHANVGNRQLYDEFEVDSSRFKCDTGKGEIVNFFGDPGDPGVFYDELTRKYYMTYVDSSKADMDDNPEKKEIGNISLLVMNSDMKSGVRMGNINFQSPYDKFAPFKEFSEGPDICVLPTPNDQLYNYYLIFSGWDAKSKSSSMIGYAMADPWAFKKDPLNCWTFKGWIMQNINNNNNHTNMIKFNGRYYFFYHRGPFGTGHSREVCVKEFELDENNEIVGVRAPDNPTDVANYASLEGLGSSIGRGFIEVQDTSYSENNTSTITIKSIRNISGRDLNYFRLVYYLTIEPGKNLTAVPVRMPTLSKGVAAFLSLRHLGSKIWSVQVDFYPGKFENNSELLGMNNELKFKIIGDNKKDNDYSHPRGAHTDLTTTIAMFDIKSDPTNPAQYPPVLGDSPDIPQGTTKYLRNRWFELNNNYAYNYLNLPDTNSNETVKINSQYLRTGSTAQEWYIEEVPSITINGKTHYFPNHEAIRIKNLRTANLDNGTGYYVTCNNIDRSGNDTLLYYVQNQKLRKDWSTQVWIKESAGLRGGVRLRSFWHKSTALTGTEGPDRYVYLTLNALGDDTAVYCQPLGQDGNGIPWASQYWYID